VPLPFYPSGSNYQIAPLDECSLVNGALKYDHPIWGLPTDVINTTISWLHRMYGSCMAVQHYSLEEAASFLERDKASGSPFCYYYGPTKGDVLNHMTPEQLFEHWAMHTQYSNATLKDEIRLVGKDSRFFVPANIQTVLIGNMLYAAQNDAIACLSAYLPIKIGLTSPGPGIYHLIQKFNRHHGKKYQYDGAQNDAHFALVLALICREFRRFYLPEYLWEMHDRYYDMVYNGLIETGGWLLQLPGQLSGQTNTATDNSIGTLAGCMIHAILHGLTYEQFMQNEFAVLGDDLMISDVHNLYDPLQLQETWNSFGMYLESPSLEEQDITDLMFMGVVPKYRDGQLLYIYRPDRLSESLNFVQKKSTMADRLEKYISIAQLMFADKAKFEPLRAFILSWVAENKSDFILHDVAYRLTDQYLLSLYTGYEYASTHRFSVFSDRVKLGQRCRTL